MKGSCLSFRRAPWLAVVFVAAQRRAVGRVSELIVARFVVAELVAARVYAELVVAECTY